VTHTPQKAMHFEADAAAETTTSNHRYPYVGLLTQSLRKMGVDHPTGGAPPQSQRLV